MSETDISTLARRLAEQNNVDWRSLEGSGPSGKVVERDVLDYLARVMAGMEDIDSTPEPLPEGLDEWPDQELPSTVQAVADPDSARPDSVSDPVGVGEPAADYAFSDDPLGDDLLSDELLSDDVFLFDGDEPADTPTVATDELPGPIASELPAELPDEVDDLLLVEDEADVFADQAGEDAHEVAHAVGHDIDQVVDQAAAQDVGHGAGPDLGTFSAGAQEAPAFSSSDFESTDREPVPPSPSFEDEAFTQVPTGAHTQGGAASDEWGVQPLAGDPFGFSDEPADEPAADEALPDLWASDDEQPHASADTGTFSPDEPAAGAGPWLSSGDDSELGRPPFDESLSAGEESWHDGDGVAPLDDSSYTAPSRAEDVAAGELATEAEEDESATFAAETLSVETHEAEPLRAAPFGVADELMASEGAQRSDEIGAMEDVGAIDGTMPEHDIVAAVAALPLVRSGSVLRRHIDVSALAAAQVAVGAELGAEPLEVAPFLVRAVARAAAELEITTGQVALAELRDGVVLRRVDDADSRPFRSLLEELQQQGAEEDEVGLVAVDLSGLDVDEVILDVAAPAITLGRILYDTQHGAYRSTLALSGELSMEKGAKLLNRVAELLDAPVRLLL